jgi:hypothetical protein
MFDNAACFDFPEVSFTSKQFDFSMDYAFPTKQISMETSQNDASVFSEDDSFLSQAPFEPAAEKSKVPTPSLTRADSIEPELGLKKSISKRKRQPRKDSFFSVSSLATLEDLEPVAKNRFAEVCYSGLEAEKARAKFKFTRILRKRRAQLSSFPLRYEAEQVEQKDEVEEEKFDDNGDVLLDLCDSEDEDVPEERGLQATGVGFNALNDCFKRSRKLNAIGGAICFKTHESICSLREESEELVE